MNTAIIVAAGSGSRFNSETPKQFLDMSGRPVIVHTLERFERTEAVDEIILVLSSDRLDWFRRGEWMQTFSKLRNVVAGGDTRAASVWQGLSAVNPETAVVAVHDGARPLVTSEEVSRTIGRAAETGAACLVTGLVDTIKHVEGDHVSGTLDRKRLRRALTPQAFRYEVLMRAYRDASFSEDATDECYLVEKTGVPVSIVEGSPRNIKITHPEDLALAEMYLRQEMQN
jgi:2-C-methyl-D-erythritol 4-phosphate cytidylyltransferase